MGYSSTGRPPTAASLASSQALSRVKALSRPIRGAINLPNEPRPIDQLPAAPLKPRAQNPWPVLAC